MSSSPLLFKEPAHVIASLVKAGKRMLQQLGFQRLVLGVSGGADSSFALYLATQILPPEQIWTYLLPVATQSTADAQKIVDYCSIPAANVNISNLEECLAAEIRRISAFDPSLLEDSPLTRLRQGNLIARLRMVTLFDQAFIKNALVLGTSNLSEKLLGYCTLYGDSASSVELFDHLYKTQIIQLASQVLPPELAHRTPSAELWAGQTDEQELGFSYAQADLVLAAHFTPHFTSTQKNQLLTTINPDLIPKVLSRVQKYHFKQEVPYSAKEFGTIWHPSQLTL